ncbi:hypothetical protein LZ496_11550 [Sphingomonas sp. NSE70-1]|uniref:Uncharacterized protein n=1 Tax=Sphingomonas caseinilyticus TaxID=2908205 RepID=A0ABT0RX57_9SPHN|nr:hypothetical protein [Sphingomonas caseinilyticus]MCL6699413.1 hypothetical protein [Sphingomonas caseinilyticus]
MRKILLFGLMLLAACNREEQPEPPTAAETERLDEAEEMLNDLANEEGAAPEGTAPAVNSD